MNPPASVGIVTPQTIAFEQPFSLQNGDTLPRFDLITETYGVPVEEIVEGIKHGVRKVNIDTDLRLASTGAIRKFLAENPAEFDPRKYLAKTIEAMKGICLARYQAFGCEGMADKIKPISLEKMATRYAKGELNQVVAK